VKQTKLSANKTVPGWRWHLIVCGIAIVLVSVAYANAFDAGFVYDDHYQIVNNPLIQNTTYFWQAIVSDVWAFKANIDTGNASNYYRPIFIAWLSLNFQLFGTNAAGWHALSIVAHLLATLLGYAVLVRMRFPPAICAIVTWLFAVHPIHVQSVTWISGSPDVLMTIFLFGSFLFYCSARQKPNFKYWAGALACYSTALLSKEPSLVFPALLVAAEWVWSRQQKQPFNLLKAVRLAVPFAALGIAFLVARYLVLGVVRSLAPGAPGAGSAVMTAPSLLWFYVLKTIWPWPLSPIYELNYVTNLNSGLRNLAVPLALLAIVGFAAYLLARIDGLFVFGIVWFLLPLVPVLDARVFIPELLVQDRYLYLPLWGALICLCGGVSVLASRFSPRHASKIIYATGIALSATLSLSTWQYNQVWKSDLNLWECGVRVSPGASFAWSQLGAAYQRTDRIDDAKNALSRAINLRPDLTSAYISMAIIANREARYNDAERWLLPVVKRFPDYDVALEQMASTYQNQGRLSDAVILFKYGRQQLPFQSDRYTVNIAVLLALSGRKAESLKELESLKPRLAESKAPDVLRAWWYLGELYKQQGRFEEARQAYNHYLNATNEINDPNTQRLRQLAVQALSQ